MARRRNITPRGRARGKGKRKRFHEQAKCRFCREKVKEVDYKDISLLTKLTTQQGKLFSRKRSGNCARHQQSSKRAIKQARYLGLLPYVA
jgi:small subunit ribosomal protein S18